MFRKYLFKRFYVKKALHSEGPMFRRFYFQRVLYSELGPMFRRSYVLNKIVQKVLYSEGSMFRRSYIQIYSEGPIFRKFFGLRRKNLHLSVSGKLQSKITNHSLSLIAHSVKGHMSFCHGALSVVCPSTIYQIRYWDFNQHSEQPQTRSDHRRIVPAIQKYDTPVDLSCNFRVLKLSRISDFGTFHFRSAIIIIIFA